MFFPFGNFFNFSNFEGIISTPKSSNKKYRSPCFFKSLGPCYLFTVSIDWTTILCFRNVRVLICLICDMCSSGCTVQSWGITLTMFVNKLICLWWWVESQWWQVCCGGELTVIRLHCPQSLMFDLCQLLIIVQLYTLGLQIITYSKDICSVFSAEAEVRAVLTFHMYLWAKLSGILTQIRWQSLNFPSLMRVILSLEYR